MQTRERNREAYVHKGSRTGLLLIHGFTGSPGEMRPLAEHFAQEGYSVTAPVLAGHCSTVEEMNGTSHSDWIQSAYNAYMDLVCDTDRIIVIGHSMGGLIAFYLANRYKVAGVVSMCTPIYFADWRAPFTPVISLFKPVHRGRITRNEEIAQYQGGYDETPLRAMRSLIRLRNVVKDELGAFMAPLLVQQARRDMTVRPASARYIYDHVGSDSKDIKWYERSGHILPVDVDRKEVWADALAFIRRIERES